MTEDENKSTKRYRRRAFITSVGASVSIAAAGCLDTSGPGGPDVGEQAPNQPLSVPARGDPEADTTVAVYQDLRCGACNAFHASVLPEIENRYLMPSQEPEFETPAIRYEYRELVLPVGELSWNVASAVRAVQQLAGIDAFWTYHDRVYANFDSLDFSVIEQLASDLPVDEAKIRSAAKTNRYYDTVNHYTTMANEDGYNATPTVEVNDEKTQPTAMDIITSIDSSVE
jgi:Protein-disulfide isomerase